VAATTTATMLREGTARHDGGHRERAEENGDLSYQGRTFHNVTKS
jgi:hypothetical protein